jgi:murein L,D-transpeptidase YcbB/YkuD
MKKIIRLSESDLKRLIERVVKEQDEVTYDMITAVQKFLNNRYKNDRTFKQLTVDGKTGDNSQTELAIKKYQKEKGLDTDGKIGRGTTGAMRKDGLDKFESKFLGLF